MFMGIYYIIGIIGVFFVFIAFIISNNKKYGKYLFDEIFNFLGSFLLSIYAFNGRMWPFFVLNIFWIIWSIKLFFSEKKLKKKKNNKKKVLYIDMDGVIVDFQSGVNTLSDEEKIKNEGKYCKVKDIFSKMKPIDGAVNAVKKLSEKYDVYILSSPGWDNASAWSDKYNWVNEYLPFMRKRLILSNHKNLNKGDYLIDDRYANGSEKFYGELIHFRSIKYKDWDSVLDHLL